jgi:hypothetical protein
VFGLPALYRGRESDFNTEVEETNMEQALDYKERLRALLAEAKGHVEAHNSTNEYLINLLDTATDYLFYLEDTSK